MNQYELMEFTEKLIDGLTTKDRQDNTKKRHSLNDVDYKGDPKPFKEKVKDAWADNKIDADGHSICAVEYFLPHFGIAELYEAGLIQTHESDPSSHKTTIYDGNGNPISHLTGINYLDFLRWVNYNLNTGKDTNKFGRGSQAQDLVTFIKEAITNE